MKANVFFYNCKKEKKKVNTVAVFLFMLPS